MSLSPSVEFSTRRLAHAARVKGLPKEAIMGWCLSDERAVVEEVYAEPFGVNAHLYIRHYGESA